MSRRRPRPIEIFALLAILLFAYALRLFRLQDASIWWDEGLAVWAARHDLGAIARWTAEDVHPPLYFWLLHYWRMLAGDSEFAVRWLSVGFGTLTVAVLWRLARRGSAPWVALLAALLLALSRFTIWWSQEARMYMLGALLATLSLYLTVRLRRTPSLRLALAYVATTAAALWTLYLLAFLLVIEGLYWLATLPRGRGARTPLFGGVARRATPPKRESWWGFRSGSSRPDLNPHTPDTDWSAALRSLLLWATLQAAVLAAFAPWLAFALPRMRSWSVQVPFEPGLFVQLYATLLVVGASIDIDRFRVIVLAVLGLVLLGLLLYTHRLWRREVSPERSRERAGLVLLTLLTVLIPPLVVWTVTTMPRAFGYSPKPEARYLLPYAPAFALLAAWAVAGLMGSVRRMHSGRALLGALAVAALLGTAGWSLNDYFAARYRQDDYISVAATMRAFSRPGDGVLLHTDQPWPVFAYHWPNRFRGITYTRLVDEAGTAAQVGPYWEAHDGLWLVLNEDSQRVDPGRVVESYLTERALARRDWRFGAHRLLYFARTPGRAATIDQLAPAWRAPAVAQPLILDGLIVEGWEQPLHRYRPGDLAHLFVTVRGKADPGRVALSLGARDDPLASASPTGVSAGTRQRLQFDLVVPPGMPGGELPWRLTNGEEEVTLGRVSLVGGAERPQQALPEIETPVRAEFGDPPLLALLGYDLAGDATPGETLHLTLYWQSLQPIPLPYKVFTHVISPDERTWGQKDDVPVAGGRPTTSWQPGEVIVDPYAIPLNKETPAGRYRVEIGFYDAATGERLGPVRDANGQQLSGERVLLGEIVIAE